MRSAEVLDLGAAMPGELTDFSRLLESVYAGPLEETPWTSFLEALRLRMNAMAVTLIIEPPSSDGPGYILNARGMAATSSRDDW